MSGIMNMFVATKTTIATAVDAFFNSVSLLLNTSSTNGAQNNTFLDSSTNNFTITRNGNTTQGTFTPFSQTGWSNFFGSSNYLTTPSSSAFNLSSGDWTIEGWFWLGSNSGDTRLFTVVNSSTDMYGAIVRSGTIRFGQLGVGEAAFGTINLNTWNHIAFSKTSTSTITCYINGTSTGTTTSYTLPNANCTVYIAASPANYALATTDGYISNFRIVKGTAVYSGSTITVPTTPLTAITNTSLLTCQSNRFIDNSTNAFAITTSGTPSVQAFSPFLPTAAYDAAVVGGSGYVGTTGAYLNVAGQPLINVNDWTVEFWMYPTQFNNNGGIFGASNGGGTQPKLYLYVTGSNLIIEGYSGGFFTALSTAVPTLNAWTYVSVSRSSSTGNGYLYYNGVLQGSAASVAAVTGITGGFSLFSNGEGSSAGFYGYMGNVRVSNTARYTGSSYSVPTSLSTSDGNTTLLVNAVNAGIFDSAAKNDLETVGNAQVSTTQAKFGTTSAAFDGTGDNLKSKLTNAIGSGDYTIEGFFYIAGTGTQYLFDIRETSQTIGAYIVSSTTTLYVNFGTTFDISASSAFTLNSWNHLAFVRSGSGSNNTSVFLNGSRVYQRTDTTDYSIVPNLFIGCENSGAFYLNGYIDDFRITKGYARYSGSTYTVPTAAFPIQ